MGKDSKLATRANLGKHTRTWAMSSMVRLDNMDPRTSRKEPPDDAADGRQ
jgi:hypothetical protein